MERAEGSALLRCVEGLSVVRSFQKVDRSLRCQSGDPSPQSEIIP